jgi:hypothetical protein
MRYAIFLTFLGTCYAREPLSQSKVLELADNQRHSGVLKQASDFLYVDLEDSWIYKIAQQLQEEGFSEPPYFGNDLVGAHISVAFPLEIEKNKEIAECGMQIAFVPKRCEIVKLDQPSSILPNVTEVYLLVVEAPELDQIREKYHLPKLRYPFHITLGVK